MKKRVPVWTGWVYRAALISLVWLIGGGAEVLAQRTLSGALNTSSQEITGVFPNAKKIFYAVCALSGLVGAIGVFNKLSNNDPESRQSAMLWGAALIFAALVTMLLHYIFGSEQ